MASARDFAVAAVEADLARVDAVTAATQAKRQAFFERLELALVHPDVAPENIDPKLGALYLKALSDQEKSAIGAAGIKLKQKETEAADATSQNVAKLLQQLSGNSGYKPPMPGDDALAQFTDAERAVEERFTAQGDEIRDTELRDEPYDLS